MHGEGFFAQALIYLVFAVLSVPIAKRLGLGSVLGYLLAGVFIGPYVLGFIGREQSEVMSFAELGVIMMLFLIGLELRPQLLWRLRHSIVGLGGLQVLLTALIIGGVAVSLGLKLLEGVSVGLILSLSSTAIVLQSFQERGLMKTPAGQSGFSVLLFQDVAVIPIIAVLPMLATGTAERSGGMDHGLAGWQQAVLIIGFVVGALLINKFVVRWVFRFIAETKLREVFTMLALLIVLGIAYIMSKIGLSPALGAFVAGVVLADNEYRHELESVIDPFKAILLGLFFISVGAGINFGLVGEKPLIIVVLVLALVVSKALVLMGLARLFKQKWSQNLWFSLSLAQGGEFAFVLFAFAVQQSVLPPDLVNLLTVVVAITMLATPMLMIFNEKVLQPRFGIEEAEIPHDTIQDQDSDVIIAGFGRFGQIVGRLLNANRIKTTVLDHNPGQIDRLRKYGFKVFYGDTSRLDLLESAGIANAKILVLAIDDADVSLKIAEMVREHYPNVRILAKAIDRGHAYDFLRMGIHDVVRETYSSSLDLGKTALRHLGFRAYQARRCALIFRQHDESMMRDLHHLWDDQKNYIIESQQSRKDLERILANDQEKADVDEEKAWDTSAMIKEITDLEEENLKPP